MLMMNRLPLALPLEFSFSLSFDLPNHQTYGPLCDYFHVCVYVSSMKDTSTTDRRFSPGLHSGRSSK